MAGQWGLMAAAAGAAAIWWAGLRSLRKSGGKREMAGFTLLLMWSAYILLSRRFGWMPMTAADLFKVVFLPMGRWVEHMLVGHPE